GSKTCEGTYFVPIEDSKVCHDYQEIKIQESTQLLGVGSIPRSIPVILMNDLVDMVKAGGITICDALILKPRLRLEGDEDKIAGKKSPPHEVLLIRGIVLRFVDHGRLSLLPPLSRRNQAARLIPLDTSCCFLCASDDVIITGVLSAKWSSDLKDVRCDLDPILIANYVR
ncbi:hypothetical protein GW17_00032257, partial [Ensete ventricosum]